MPVAHRAQDMIKRGLVVLGGLAAGLLLCWALIMRLGIKAQDWSHLCNGFSWPWAGAVALLAAILMWSGACKWALWSRALHGKADIEPSQRFFLRHYTWQNWIGLFVPPAMAIIVGRSWAGRSMPGIGWRGGAGNGFYDQLMEFALLAGLAPAAALILLCRVETAVWLTVAAIGLLSVGSLIWLLRRRMPQGLAASLVPLLLLSAFRVIVTVASYVAGTKALGLAIAPAHIVAAAPLAAVLVVLPFTPGNLGIAEWGWTGLLVLAGTGAIDAGLFAFGFRVLWLAALSVLLVSIEAACLAARPARL